MLSCMPNTETFCICSFHFPFFFKLVTFCIMKPSFSRDNRVRATALVLKRICVAHMQAVDATLVLLPGGRYFPLSNCLCLMSGYSCSPWGGKSPRAVERCHWGRLPPCISQNCVRGNKGHPSLCFLKCPFKTQALFL